MGGPDKSGLTFATTYVLSATSACIAETVTFPVRPWVACCNPSFPASLAVVLCCWHMAPDPAPTLCAGARARAGQTNQLDIIKTRLQVQTAADATKRGIFQTAAGIVKEEGVLGLYGGLGPVSLSLSHPPPSHTHMHHAGGGAARLPR